MPVEVAACSRESLTDLPHRCTEEPMTFTWNNTGDNVNAAPLDWRGGCAGRPYHRFLCEASGSSVESLAWT